LRGAETEEFVTNIRLPIIWAFVAIPVMKRLALTLLLALLVSNICRLINHPPLL
jgi:hypothetical protein